ncbi:MAG: YcaQ family DNA glycosylase, partial [Bacteroidia bacterium]|nr:YcaQ family DNA glycosylase [Bacteroidia bacterium]
MTKQSISISKKEAQQLVLKAQGLIKSNFGKSKQGALNAIEQLGYIQIDTLSVVTRAHHHTLWSRVNNYNESDLHQLLEKDKSIFEYWSHAASYLPMSSYKFSLIQKNEYVKGKSHWFEQDVKIKKYVLDKIKQEGPLQSKDFEHVRNVPANWYEWKPAKKALEQLFMEGKLMVAKRQGFQKVYDLTERVLPSKTDVKMPSIGEYAEFLIQSAIQSNGIVTEKEITYLRKGLKTPVQKALKKMLEQKEILTVQVEFNTEPYYSTSKLIDKLKLNVKQKELHLLSPFDNSIIQRKRLQNIFDFDYTIECYVPEEKRKYGYFCLPILYGTEFIGRLDPKADRKSKTFYVKSMYFEKGFQPDAMFTLLFSQKLKEFALFNGCTNIELNCANKKWERTVRLLI